MGKNRINLIAIIMVLLAFNTAATAQESKNRVFTFSSVEIYDDNDQIIYEKNNNNLGVITFVHEKGIEFVTIIIEGGVLFNEIIEKKEEDEMNDEIAYYYTFKHKNNGKPLPMVLTAIYTPSVSSTYPTRFILLTINEEKREVITSTVFRNISRVD